MKKLIAGFFALAVFSVSFTSCDKLSQLDDTLELLSNASISDLIAVEDLPSEVLEYTNENYFETFVDEAFRVEGAGFRLDFDSGDRQFFDEEGKPIRFKGKKRGHHYPCGQTGDLINIADLPAAVTNYIATNYPNDTIKGAKEFDDYFLVGLTSHTILKFDENGNFIEALDFVRRKCNGDKGERVEFENLPQVIQDYVTNNYSIDDFKVAFKKEDKFIIGLSVNGDRVILGFDLNGTLLFTRIC